MANDITQLFIILFSIISIESLALLFVLWKTPAMPFLASFLFKRPVMYLIGKDKMGIFKTFKSKHGSAVVKGVGIFNLTENSHTLEANVKTPIYFAFRDQAATLDVEYPAVLQEIKENSIKITDITDLENFIANIKKGVEKDFPIQVKPFKTYRFHDLQNMFPFNLDPTFIDAQVQGELNKYMKLVKATPTIIGGIVVLLMVSAIAVFIIQRAFKGCIGAAECQGMVSAAKCVVGNTAQQIVNTTALVT